MRGMPTYDGGGGGGERVWMMWRVMVGRGMHQVTSERARARRHMWGLGRRGLCRPEGWAPVLSVLSVRA